MNFDQIFSPYAFLAFEKQARLSELIDEHEWNLDTENAEVTFDNLDSGEQFTFPVQFLGTESEVSNSWLWADANSGLPDESLSLCRKVRAIGKELEIESFTTNQFEITDELYTPDCHKIAMLSVCLGDASCYYRGPYEGGAVFFTISDLKIDQLSDLDREGLYEAFSHYLWEHGDLKSKVISYLSTKGYIDKNFNGDKVTCELYTGEEVEITIKMNPDGSSEFSFDTDFE